MSKIDKLFDEAKARHDTFIFDNTTSALYNYSGWAPRLDSAPLEDTAARTATAMWYVERTSKTSPYLTEAAGLFYNRKWDTVVADGIPDSEWA